MKKLLSLFFVCLMLIACVGCFASCDAFNSNTASETNGDTEVKTVTFTFEVEHLDGTKKSFEVTTDASSVGEALQGQGYIDGYQSQYGLTVETVDGETLDWNTSKAYWSFYINGKYANYGVDSTKPENGAIYLFKAVKK